jgi:hypothetical protein
VVIAEYSLPGEDLSEVKIEDLVLVRRGPKPLYILAVPDDREIRHHFSSPFSITQKPYWHFKGHRPTPSVLFIVYLQMRVRCSQMDTRNSTVIPGSTQSRDHSCVKLKAEILRPGSWQASVANIANMSGEALEKKKSECNAFTTWRYRAI